MGTLIHTVGVSGSSPLAPTKSHPSRRSGSQNRAAFRFPYEPGRADGLSNSDCGIGVPITIVVA